MEHSFQMSEATNKNELRQVIKYKIIEKASIVNLNSLKALGCHRTWNFRVVNAILKVYIKDHHYHCYWYVISNMDRVNFYTFKSKWKMIEFQKVFQHFQRYYQ